MSFVTIEVDMDHGRVTPRGDETLPDRCSALLPLVPESTSTFVQDGSVESFIAKWAGAFAMPPSRDFEEDARLAYLPGKHLK